MDVVYVVRMKIIFLSDSDRRLKSTVVLSLRLQLLGQILRRFNIFQKNL
jgi:hypothetical protein